MVFFKYIDRLLFPIASCFVNSAISYMIIVLGILLLVVIIKSSESPDMIKRRLEQKEYKKKEFEKREKMCKNAIPASSTLKPGFNFVASNQQH